MALAGGLYSIHHREIATSAKSECHYAGLILQPSAAAIMQHSSVVCSDCGAAMLQDVKGGLMMDLLEEVMIPWTLYIRD